jgi:hypothetical protein
MRFFFAAIVMCMLLLDAPSAKAEFYNGKQLAEGLDDFFKPLEEVDKNGMFRGGAAMGFIKGVCDALEDEGFDLAPENVTPGEIAVVLRDYLRRHRDELDQPAAALVRRGLEEKFPAKWPATPPKSR